jgi:DNA recombination protein RmuC
MAFELIILAVVVAGFITLFYFLNTKLTRFLQRAEDSESQRMLMEWLKNTRQSIDQTKDITDKRLDKMNDRLSEAAKVFAGVQKELGTMRETSKMMKDLQDFLQSPKLRGGVGERVLADTLAQMLPAAQYDTQYKFTDGNTVDAIIKTDQGLIPIDAKFPMENFKKLMQAESENEKESYRKKFVRDVKKHIDDISKKYIIPGEGTINFALMYIPSEAVYYEVAVQNEDLDDYAYQRKVTFVSPNTFTYFLKILLLGLQEKKVAESAQKILQVLGSIRREAENFGEELGVVSRHITNAKSAMDRTTTQYQQLSSRIESIRMLREAGEEISSEMDRLESADGDS